MCLSMAVGLVALITQPEFVGPLLGARCARVIIEGNTDTPDHVIRDLLDICAGQRIRLGSIQEARQRLRKCPTLQYYPWLGIGPTVEMLPSGFESTFWDIRIRVVDRPGSWLRYSLSDLYWSSVYAMAFRNPNAVREIRRRLEYIADRLHRESQGEP